MRLAVGYRHQWYNFGLDGNTKFFAPFPQHLHDLDFNAQTVFTDLRWARGKWVAGIGADYVRLMTTSNYREFYQEFAPRWTLQYVVPMGADANLTLVYEGNYHVVQGTSFPDQDFNERTDQGIFASYTRTLCKHVVLQPFYEFKYTHFVHFSGGFLNRDDYLNSVGLGIYYRVCEAFNIHGFVDYEIRRLSSGLIPNYDQLNAGGGLTLDFRF